METSHTPSPLHSRITVHPVPIGDEFHNGRYLILRRLGHSLYSTVWLALNQHYQNHSCCNDLPHLRFRYSAVKTLAADATDENYDGHNIRQLRPEPQPKDAFARIFLRLLDTFEDAKETFGGEFVVSLLDEFEAQGSLFIDNPDCFTVLYLQ